MCIKKQAAVHLQLTFLFPLGFIGLYCLLYPEETFVCWAFPPDFHVLCVYSYAGRAASTATIWRVIIHLSNMKKTRSAPPHTKTITSVFSFTFSLMLLVFFRSHKSPASVSLPTLWREKKTTFLFQQVHLSDVKAPVWEIPKKAVIPLPVCVSWHSLGCRSRSVDVTPGCTCQLSSVLCGSCRFINVLLLKTAKILFTL